MRNVNGLFKKAMLARPRAMRVYPLMAIQTDGQTVRKVGQARSYAAPAVMYLSRGFRLADFAPRVSAQKAGATPAVLTPLPAPLSADPL
jgi:hypothetical protein